MFKILIIEDNYELSLLMKEHIENNGFQAEVIKSFTNIETEIEKSYSNLILLDIKLPYCDGYYLCRKIRKSSNIPIIIVSSNNEEMQQVMGIELGADDYIVKPFSFEILIAKIKASIRRSYGNNMNKTTNIYSIGKLLLDENTFKLVYKSISVELTKNEFRLLKNLIKNKNTIVKRDILIKDLWDCGCFVDDNTLSVNMTRVKNKLKVLGLKDIIQTKRGVGYMINSKLIEGENIE